MANLKAVDSAPASDVRTVKVTLKLFEPKKNSVRYKAVGDDTIITDAYVMKHSLTQPWPEQIECTFTYPTK